MPAVSGARMRDVDWRSIKSVVALARELGPGMTVTRHEGRQNYNITHTARRDLWENVPGVKVYFHTT